MNSLNPVDIQIMKALNVNAMQSNRSIADQIQVDATTIGRRKQQLFRKGTMRLVTCFNPEECGMSTSVWFSFNVSYHKCNIVAKQLAQLPQTITVGIYTGRYNMILYGVFESNDELAEFMLKDAKEFTNLREAISFISLRRYKGRYLPVSADRIFPENSLDNKIANSLNTDPLQSSHILAEKYKVDASTIRRRRKKIFNSGKIHVLPLFKPEALGLTITSLIVFNIDYSYLDSAAELLAKHPQVTWVDITSGRFDLFITALFHSSEDLNAFMIEKTRQIKGLRDSETFILINRYKGGYISLSEYVSQLA